MHEQPAPPSLTGVSHALLAYTIWGIAPVYWKVTSVFPARELLAWRVLASFTVALVLVGVARGWHEVWGVLRRPRAAAAGVGAAALIATNWLVFIHAVQTDRILATSLGYYINPLMNVGLGLVVLRERQSRAQSIAVVLASVGVAFQTWQLGTLPWISLVLAGSFGLYAFVRKTAPAPPLAGFCLETAVLSPFALAMLLWLDAAGESTVASSGLPTLLLVAGSGVLTAAPLLAFASAAKRLPLGTLGMFQYLAPTIAFLLAVGLYRESFTAAHAVSFGCVWTALALVLWDSLRRRS
jgi:chloramphenicol-sensitive protein RarD